MSILLRRTTGVALAYTPALSVNNVLLKRCTFPHSDKQLLNRPVSPVLSYQCRHFSVTNAFVNTYDFIAASAVVGHIQNGIIQIHDFTGLPWWATIILSTVLFRTAITLPLAVYQAKIVARLELISLEMPAIVAELKSEANYAKEKFKLTETQTRLIYNRSLKTQWNKLIVRENCHPLKTVIVIWGQIPLWICQSVAVRNLVRVWPDPTSIDAQMIYMALKVGGFAWISDLTVPDTTMIFPVALMLVNLINIEVQTLSRRRKNQGRLSNYFAWIGRGAAIIMLPLAVYVPSCLALYWTTSSSVALAQNLLLASPKFKRLTGIPTNNPSHLENPYQHIAAGIVQKLNSIIDKSSRSKKMNE